jgi:uncharacterized repeat protein (TIGR01451 family)
MRSPAGLLLVLAVTLAAALGIPALAGAAPEVCSASGPTVCVQLTHTPDSLSAAAPGSTTYASLTATVRNTGSNTATHVVVTDTLPAGTSVVPPSVTPSRGTCATTASDVTCDVGRLASGEVMTLRVSVTAPADAGQITNAVTARFDENTNDSSAPDPKQDLVTATDPIAVNSVAGLLESWVPAETTADLSTDPSGSGVATPGQSQIAGVHVPAQSTGLAVKLARTPGAFTCPKNEICRGGDWIEASVPGTFVDPPLRFSLRWDASLVTKKQTARNLNVYYTQCLTGCAVQTISRRCTSATPTPSQQPCLFGIKQEADGDFSAVLIQDHNGYMR